MTDISLGVGLGLVCALLSALGTNLAFLLKHKGAVAAPDIEMRHPLRSVADLFRSKWWTIGWGVSVVAFALHAAALTLAPLSIGQAVLAGGLVFLAVLAERFFGFALGRRQWIGIVLVAVSLSLLTVTGGGGGGGANADYSLAGMIIFEAVAVGVGLLLVVSHLVERIPAQRGVLLGIAAGLGFGISDVAIKALSGELDNGLAGLLSPWSAIIVPVAVFSFYASARSLQIGDGVAVTAVTSVAANLSAIIAGVVALVARPRGRPPRRQRLKPSHTCGEYKRRAPGIAVNGRVSPGTWRIQVDQKRTYSASTRPAVVGTTVVFTTFRPRTAVGAAAPSSSALRGFYRFGTAYSGI